MNLPFEFEIDQMSSGHNASAARNTAGWRLRFAGHAVNSRSWRDVMRASAQTSTVSTPPRRGGGISSARTPGHSPSPSRQRPPWC